VSKDITIEEVIYGTIDNAKIDILDNDPPDRTLNIPRIPLALDVANSFKASELTPGIVIYEPSRQTNKAQIVKRSFLFNSCAFEKRFAISIDSLSQLNYTSAITIISILL
jgi:hypothetical protein